MPTGSKGPATFPKTLPTVGRKSRPRVQKRCGQTGKKNGRLGMRRPGDPRQIKERRGAKGDTEGRPGPGRLMRRHRRLGDGPGHQPLAARPKAAASRPAPPGEAHPPRSPPAHPPFRPAQGASYPARPADAPGPRRRTGSEAPRTRRAGRSASAPDGRTSPAPTPTQSPRGARRRGITARAAGREARCSCAEDAPLLRAPCRPEDRACTAPAPAPPLRPRPSLPPTGVAVAQGCDISDSGKPSSDRRWGGGGLVQGCKGPLQNHSSVCTKLKINHNRRDEWGNGCRRNGQER